MTVPNIPHQCTRSHAQPNARQLSLLVVVVIGGCLGALCDSFYGVSGRVVSCDAHTPLPDAEVMLDVPELERRGSTETDSEGRFHVAVNYPEGPEASELTISKPGYQVRKQSVDDPKIEQNLCLEPIESK